MVAQIDRVTKSDSTELWPDWSLLADVMAMPWHIARASHAWNTQMCRFWGPLCFGPPSPRLLRECGFQLKLPHPLAQRGRQDLFA